MPPRFQLGITGPCNNKEKKAHLASCLLQALLPQWPRPEGDHGARRKLETTLHNILNGTQFSLNERYDSRSLGTALDVQHTQPIRQHTERGRESPLAQPHTHTHTCCPLIHKPVESTEWIPARRQHSKQAPEGGA